MATVLKEQCVPRPSRSSVPAERSITDIISAGRATRAGSLGVWGLAWLSSVLLWASFTPLDWGPLAWFALVPVLLLVRLKQKTRWMYTALYVVSTLMWVATLQWMRLGDQTMYLAWLALAVYIGLYLPAFVGLTRVAVHRLGTPLVVAAPVVWVGLEFFRAHLMTGFPWYFLGHTQHHWASLTQIADLVGAYGISFVIVGTSAALALMIPARWLIRFRLLTVEESRNCQRFETPVQTQRIAAVTALLLVGCSLIYGTVRRAQADFQTGPRVALVQGNFTTSVKHDPQQWQQMFRIHRYLTGLTVQHQPDLIVWPETMFRWPLLSADRNLTSEQLTAMQPQIAPGAWRDRAVRDELLNLAEEANAAAIIGIDAFDATLDGVQHYNSAAFVEPGEGLTARYDKLHRVPFGEYIPLRETFPWLQKLTPFGDDFGIAAGKGVHVFDDGQWRYVPLICFEDTVPHLVRGMVRSAETARSRNLGAHGSRGDSAAQIDCLVNLTNDGWFHGSSELDQHLITARFRCIETRTPMVRAVNTGISAIIDGDGLVVEPEVFIDLDGLSKEDRRRSIRDPETGKLHKQLNCAQVGAVPLDNRGSLYVIAGDWFAGLCAACCLCLVAVGVVRRRTPTAPA
jgi:apolipoprotein N-acyltransferase